MQAVSKLNWCIRSGIVSEAKKIYVSYTKKLRVQQAKQAQRGNKHIML